MINPPIWHDFCNQFLHISPTILSGANLALPTILNHFLRRLVLFFKIGFTPAIRSHFLRYSCSRIPIKSVSSESLSQVKKTWINNSLHLFPSFFFKDFVVPSASARPEATSFRAVPRRRLWTCTATSCSGTRHFSWPRPWRRIAWEISI